MSTNLTVRVDKDVKEQSQLILSNLGLDLSSVINVLLRQIILKKAVPFSIDSRTVAEETALAINNANEGVGLSKEFDSTNELMKDLNTKQG